MNRDLPKHLYRQGTSYRAKLPDGRRLNLGTNEGVAIQKLNVLLSTAESIDTLDPKVSAEIWRRHQKGARQRKLEFAITAADILSIFEKQGHRCAVTGLPFRADKPNGMRVKPWAPSLDRITGSAGYVAGNVRIVCCFVNIAMNGFGDEFFSQVLEPLVEARVQAEMWNRGLLVFPK